MKYINHNSHVCGFEIRVLNIVMCQGEAKFINHA